MARKPLHFRIGEGGVDWLNKMASRAGSTRSDALRAALKVAARHETEVGAELARITGARL